MGNLWKLFRNSKLFLIHRALTQHMWKKRGTIAFDVITDLDPDLFVEWALFSRSYFRGRVKMTHSTAHYPLRQAAAGVFLSKCSAYWWIEIHVSRFRYDNPRYLAFNSHLLSPQNSSLSPLSSLVLRPHFHSHSIIPHLFFTPCVISRRPPPSPTHHLHHLHLSLFSFLSSLSTISSPLRPCPARNCWN